LQKTITLAYFISKHKSSYTAFVKKSLNGG